MCPQGSLRADFYFSGQSQGRFHPTPKISVLRAHILAFQGRFQGSRLITRYSTDTEDFRAQGTFRALRALRADFLTHPYYLKFKNWNLWKLKMSVILSFLKMWQKITLSHSDVLLWTKLSKKSHFCRFVCGLHFQISLNVLYETIF